MAAIIAIKDLVKDFQLGEVPVHVLKGISFEIERGEFVSIMGSSGSGKSTLMNILGCLDTPTSGSYTLDGISAGALNSDQLAEIRNKKLGFVFQQFNLLARTSATENVELPLLYTDMSARERQERARKALLAVGLAGREDHQPSQLSAATSRRMQPPRRRRPQTWKMHGCYSRRSSPRITSSFRDSTPSGGCSTPPWSRTTSTCS